MTNRFTPTLLNTTFLNKNDLRLPRLKSVVLSLICINIISSHLSISVDYFSTQWASKITIINPAFYTFRVEVIFARELTKFLVFFKLISTNLAFNLIT